MPGARDGDRSVLVTGASGFIGRALVAELTAQGRTVSALVRCREQAIALGVPGIVGDITAPESLVGVAGFSEVFHLAGTIAARTAAEFQRVNADGTHHLYRALRRASHRPRRVIHVSSIAAGGPAPDTRPRREDDPDSPVSVYGRSKRAAEEVARASMGDLPLVIMRLPAVYGPGDRNLLPIFRMAGRGLVLRPPEQPKLFSLVHVADVARILRRAAAVDALVGGLYHVATGLPTSWDELVTGIGSAMGRRPRQLTLGRFPWVAAAYVNAARSRLRRRARVELLIPQKLPELFGRYWHVDGGRLWSALGHVTTTPLGEGLLETATWYREHGWLQ